ncbi:L-lactate permease, partial [Escherichia coli]|nr:L-lactate permease [Escherichia coli]
AGLCLIVNTAPVGVGAKGVPVLVAGQGTGIDPFHIGAMAGRPVPFLSGLVPVWLGAIMGGGEGGEEAGAAALGGGGRSAVRR